MLLINLITIAAKTAPWIVCRRPPCGRFLFAGVARSYRPLAPERLRFKIQILQTRRYIPRRDCHIAGHAYHAGIATQAVFLVITVAVFVVDIAAHPTFVTGQKRYARLGLVRIDPMVKGASCPSSSCRDGP